jgi:hypothetical protein
MAGTETISTKTLELYMTRKILIKKVMIGTAIKKGTDKAMRAANPAMSRAAI